MEEASQLTHHGSGLCGLSYILHGLDGAFLTDSRKAGRTALCILYVLGCILDQHVGIGLGFVGGMRVLTVQRGAEDGGYTKEYSGDAPLPWGTCMAGPKMRG